MRTILLYSILASLALISTGCRTTSGDPVSAAPPPAARGADPGLKLENLLTSELEGVSGTEVIVSRVTIPPNTSLPKHWHPGEEFAYVIDGAVTLWQNGKRNITGKKGDVLKVPLKQIHTAITHEEGVTLLIFRVHEQGQPERILTK